MQGGELSASNVSVETGGGGVQLKRLIGQLVRVSTEGGPIGVTALYGECFNLTSGW